MYRYNDLYATLIVPALMVFTVEQKLHEITVRYYRFFIRMKIALYPVPGRHFTG